MAIRYQIARLTLSPIDFHHFPSTHYVMVIGDSNVSEIFFDTADFLIDIAERNSFQITNKWSYKIKNRFMRFDRKGRGGIIEIDWVLDFVRK